MASVYSVRFLAVTGLSTFEYFDAPEGFVIVIRDISGFFGSQTTAPSINVDVNGTKFAEFDTTPLGLTGFHWEGRVVCEHPDRITATAANGNGDITISGYQLTLP